MLGFSEIQDGQIILTILISNKLNEYHGRENMTEGNVPSKGISYVTLIL